MKACLVCLGVLCVGVSCINAATVFFDGTFNNADWNETKIVDTANNGSFSAFQMASGGNPGSFRETNQSLNQGLLGVSHLRSTFAYNPSTQGAITSIDVSYDLQEFAPLGGFEVVYGILAFQNNTYYIGPTENLNQSSWTSFSHHGLTEASFSDTFGASGPLGPGPATPDFAANGGAIEFGFFSGNTPIGGPFNTTSGIDNLSITINSIPEPASGGLISIGLGGLAILRWRLRESKC